MQNMANDSPKDQKASWGTKEFFSRHFSSKDPKDPSSYYSHDCSGYQIFRHRRLGACLREGLNGRKVGSLLDIGCGTGVLTNLLARQQDIEEAVGIDFVGGAVACAMKSFPALDFRVSALPALDFPAEGFDVVVASEVLYYLNENDRQETLRGISRVLKPGGYLLFTSRLGERYFSVESGKNMIEEYFSILRCWYFHNKLYHRLSSPVRGVKALQDYVVSGKVDKYKKLISFLKHYGRILKKPVFRSILGVANALGNGFMRSARIPAFCHQISHWILPGMTKSNIVIFARKP